MEDNRPAMMQPANFFPSVLLLILVAATAATQESDGQVLDLRSDTAAATAEITAFVQHGLPKQDVTRASLFVLNQPKLTIPLLVDEIRRQLPAVDGDQRRLHVAAELIAYATSEASIDFLAELVRLDQETFLPYVEKTLTYGTARERDFDLAAYAAEKHPVLIEPVEKWVNRTLEYPRADEALATAVFQGSRKTTQSSDRFRRLVELLEPAKRQKYHAALRRVRNRNTTTQASPSNE